MLAANVPKKASVFTKKQEKCLKKFNTTVLSLFLNVTQLAPNCTKSKATKLQYESFVANNAVLQQVALLKLHKELKPHKDLITVDNKELRRRNMDTLVAAKLPLFGELALAEKWPTFTETSKDNLGQYCQNLWKVTEDFVSEMPKAANDSNEQKSVAQPKQQTLEQLQKQLPPALQQQIQQIMGQFPALNPAQLEQLLTILPESVKVKMLQKGMEYGKQVEQGSAAGLNPAQMNLMDLTNLGQELMSDVSEEDKQQMIAKMTEFVQNSPELMSTVQQFMMGGSFGGGGGASAFPFFQQ
jgi:hypothetical protein